MALSDNPKEPVFFLEALQYPNLKDPELMKHYNCADMTEMPLKVFSRNIRRPRKLL